MNGRQFIRKLRKAGVRIDTKRGKGGHVRLSHEGRSTVLPVHGDTDLAPEFLRARVPARPSSRAPEYLRARVPAPSLQSARYRLAEGDLTLGGDDALSGDA